MKRILVLSLLALFCSTAYAAPKTRTSDQWKELCKGAVPAKNLRTARLVTSKGVAPIKATLAAEGLSQFKEESVPDVLVDHLDGTCGYDNRPLFYQITRRPHEENGKFVIGDYRDGSVFTDPARKVPDGTMWGAKRLGVEVYLPVQLGECDRDLASCKGAYERIVAERDALKAQLASGIVTSGNTTAVPEPQVTTPIAPTTPVVAGTVKSTTGRSLKVRVGFLMIGLASGLATLYLLLSYKRQMGKAAHAYKQSHHDMHQTIVRLRAERDEAHRALEQIRQTLVGEREAAAAIKTANDHQLDEVREQRDVAERALATLRTEVATMNHSGCVTRAAYDDVATTLRERTTSLEHAVTRDSQLADDLREAKSELAETRASLDEALAAMVELGIDAKGNLTAQAKELATSIVETSDARDRAREEVGQLTGELAYQIEKATARLQAVEGANVLEDLASGAAGPEGTFARGGSGIEERVDDLDERVGRIEELEAARMARKTIESALGVVGALVRASRSKRLRDPAQVALRQMWQATATLPAPAASA